MVESKFFEDFWCEICCLEICQEKTIEMKDKFWEKLKHSYNKQKHHWEGVIKQIIKYHMRKMGQILSTPFL